MEMGLTVILVEHHMNIVKSISDYVTVLDECRPDSCINFADKWAFKPSKRGLSLNFRVISQSIIM